MPLDPIRVARWMRMYRPCENGVHVAALGEDIEFGGITVKNFPCADLSVFRECSTAGDDWDLMADLMKDGAITEQCGIRRQDLAIIERRLQRGDSR